jgi:hypothetical protein
MKPIEKFIFHSAAYTVIIAITFYIFSLFGGLTNAEMTFLRFLLILAFGVIISGAEFIFTIERLPKILRYAIHFLALFVGFFVIFLSVRSEGGDLQFSAATIFAALIIFAALYALIALVCYLVSKLILKLPANAKENAVEGRKSTAQNGKRKPYKNRFTD